MSGLEDRLSLDVSDALAAIESLDAAFAQLGKTLQESLDEAVANFTIPDATVELSADTEGVTSSLDEAIEAVDTDVVVEADASEVTTGIDAAVAEADTTVVVEADTSGVEDALSGLEGETIEVGVETTGIDEAAEELGGLSGASDQAADSASNLGLQVGGMSALSRLAAGDVGGLTSVIGGMGAAGAVAAGGIGVLAVAGGALAKAAIDGRSSQERFNLVLGEFATQVDRIDIGGLNTNLQDLSVLLGVDDDAAQEAAASIFTLGRAAGAADEDIARTTEQILALAARAVALKPSLGDVGTAADGITAALARGGRAATRFNLSLSSAEVVARALQDTGKTVSSELSLFEKSAAGAAIASERLGDSLATDVQQGSANIKTQFASVRAAFDETIESLGQPLVDPLLASIQNALPAFEALAGVFAEILEGALPLVESISGSFAPALEAVVPLASAVGDALGIFADILGVIPGPLQGATVATIGLAVAFNRLTAALVASRLQSFAAGFGGSLGAISKFAGPAALGIAGIGTAIAFVNSQVRAGENALDEFFAGLTTDINASESLDELNQHLENVRATAEKARRDAEGKRGGFLGSFAQTGDIRDLDNLATGLESIDVALVGVINTAKSLQIQYGLTESAALALARNPAQLEAFKAQQAALDETSAGFAQATAEEERFWLAAQTGTLTLQEVADEAARTGVSFEDLGAQVSEARQPILDLANTLVESLPAAEEALTSLGENDGLDQFLTNLEQNVADAAAFIGNLNTLVELGAEDLARILSSLASTDPQAAAKLAAEAVKGGVEGVLDAERRVDASNFGNDLVAIATQNVTDKLSGGLEQATLEAQIRWGNALLAIPGQLEGDAANLAADITDTISDELLKQTGAVEFEEVGRNIDEGIAAGMVQSTSAIEGAAALYKARVVATLNSVFQIFSPSKVTQEIGELVAEGFVVGLADIEGAADTVDPILAKMDELKLGAEDLAKATGTSVDEIVRSLEGLGAAEKELTADELVDVGKAVEALGGSAGVKKLQDAITKQVAAAFKGMSVDEIEAVVSKLNTSAALTKVAPIIGVTPNVPVPFETNVVEGADASTRGTVVGELTVNVTPPPEATPFEMALLIARASGWVLQGVQ